ncbi:hypothetical protein O7623_18330 [Solwaraspora sp. WMMD791]|uniref:hypothetical protein n=1 Tax=unclassified Solwaraspora TaxID=2627926 RepID=UPI00249B0AC0|nr:MULTISPECIES: hypothetical protein [unclassified Solwaraspora]WFE25351.1 hypothetical protein O7623_18330 [Solwaraspora sp. WMMD791]WJK43862.1 hypothetical protein O7608_06385 [Solwaraspora sp. WMMA2056]
MSVIRPGDEDMHFEDGSHRWYPFDPADDDQQAWEDRVREHQRQHREEEPRPRRRWPRRSI